VNDASTAEHVPGDLLTIEEWAAMPEDDEGELVDGVLVEEEMPDLTHEIVVAWLLRVIGALVVPRSGFVFGSEARFAVGPRRGRKPDLTVYLPGCPALPRRGVVRIPPDIVVEVISRTRKDHRRDRQDKALDYARWGVPWYWLVDPEARTLEILRRDEDERYDRAALVSAGVLDVVPGCDGLVLDLDALWAEIDRLADIESDEA